MKIRITVENADDLAQVHQWTVETDMPLERLADELLDTTPKAIAYWYAQQQFPMLYPHKAAPLAGERREEGRG